jgi:glutamine---fructose-6-phosphate transaminase (isomerizing)
VIGSTISREVDSVIYLQAGPEIGVASTKAFSSQVLALFLLALYIKQEKEGSLDLQLINEIKKTPKLIEAVFKQNDLIKKIANDLNNVKNFLFLGRGINFPVALEGALKLKEISYIHAEGYPAAEIKHGPIALIDKNMPVLFLATKNDLLEKVISNMQEIKSRGGKIISIVNNKRKELVELSDYLIIVPETIPELAGIINSIPLQLLAYHIANQKGINVDRPRNLAKSVTVE